jgi:hypothetical protein
MQLKGHSYRNDEEHALKVIAVAPSLLRKASNFTLLATLEVFFITSENNACGVYPAMKITMDPLWL